MTSPAQQWDVIVVGAGIAGLTTAAYLTACGTRTLVLEYGDVVGGSTHVFRRKNQWEFDVGIHHLGNCATADGLVPTMLRGLGLEGRIEFLPLDPAGIEHYTFPDLQITAPRGFDAYEEAMISAFPGDERGLRRFMRVMRGIGGALDYGRTPASLRGLAAYAVRGRHHSAWTLVPLQKLYDFCGLSGRAQLALSMANVSYMTPPSRAPVGIHAAFLEDYIHRGGSYPKGGGQMFAAHLTDVIRTHGGDVRTRAHVEGIIVGGGRVTGVRLLDGELISAPVVVSSVDVKRTFLDMVGREHLKLRTVKRVEGGRMAMPWFNAYIGLDIDLRERVPNRDHLSFPTWDSFDDVFSTLTGPRRRTDAWMDELGRQLPAYIHSSTLKDPTNTRYAPPGHTALEVMMPITGDYGLWGLERGPAEGERYQDNTQYLELKEHLTDVMIQRLEEAIPGTKDHVVWRESGTPITQERYTNPTGGSAYGLEIAVDQFAQVGRYGVRTEVPGLFLAGSSCTWGPGVEGTMHSGVYAAGAVLGRDLAGEVRGGAVLGDPSRLTPMTPDWDPLDASRRLSKKQPRSAAALSAAASS